MQNTMKHTSKYALVLLLAVLMVLTGLMAGGPLTLQAQAADEPFGFSVDGQALTMTQDGEQYGSPIYRVDVPEGTTTVTMHRYSAMGVQASDYSDIADLGTEDVTIENIQFGSENRYSTWTNSDTPGYFYFQVAKDPIDVPTGNFVTMTVEGQNSSLGDWAVEPTQVEYSDTVKTLGGLLDAVLGEGNYAYEPYASVNPFIASVTVDGQSIGLGAAAYQKTDKWHIMINNSDEKLEDYMWLASSPADMPITAGDVIRVIYSADKGPDIGYNDSTKKLNTDKDDLLTILANLEDSQRQGDAYTEAMRVAGDVNATEDDVYTAAQALNEAANQPSNPATDIGFTTTSSTSDQVMEGLSKQLTYWVEPADTTDTLVWESSDPDTVAVDQNGVVTGKQQGSATITVTAGSVSASTEITVVERHTFTLSIENAADGSYLMEPTCVFYPYEEPLNILYYTLNREEVFGRDNFERDHSLDEDWNSVYTLTGLTTDGSNWLRNGDKGDNSKWYTFINSQESTLSDRVAENDVVRLIYSGDNGNDIGLQDGSLSVNKDDLLSYISGIQQDKIGEEGSDTYQAYHDALDMVLNASATEEQVQDALTHLDETFNPVIPATNISVAPTSASIGIGKTQQFTATVEPANTTDTIQWQSSSPAVATVDDKGLVTGVSEGSATITAFVNSSSGAQIYAEAKVNVYRVPATSITLPEDSVELQQGDNYQITPTIEPADTTDTVTYSSDDSKVATVNTSGNVVAIGEGSTVIRAVVGEKQATLNVTVTARELADGEVYFQYSDGRIQTLDDNNTITLTTLDQGKFYLGGNTQSSYWEGLEDAVDSSEGYIVWIGTDGTFYPNGVKSVEASVYTANPSLGGELIANFTLNVVSSGITEIQPYVNGEAVNEDTALSLSGTGYGDVTLKGRTGSAGEWIDIPAQAFTLSCDDNGWTMGTSFGLNRDGQTATFTAAMLDDPSVTASFKATSVYVALEDFELTVPEQFSISQWSGLREEWIGIGTNDSGITPRYSVTFTPANASNTDLIWEDLTPEIATHEETYGNGICPKTNGTAKFRVTSADNPKLTHDVTVEITYERPVESVDLENKNITVAAGESIDLDYIITPSNATEWQFNYEYSEAGIVSCQDTWTNPNTSTTSTPPIIKHQLTALQPGTVTVTAKSNDTTHDAQVQFTVTVTEGTGPSVDYVQMAKDDIAHGVTYLQNKTTAYVCGNEWPMFSILRSGNALPSNAKADYVASLNAGNVNEKKRGVDLFRIAMTLGVLDVDATNVDGNGLNVIEAIYNNTSIAKDTSNSACFALIALDTKDYTVPDDALWTREKLIDHILSFQCEDGSFGLSGGESTGSIDMTGMCMQALAPYYNDNDDVKAAFNKGLEYLKGEYTVASGGFGNSVESTAQVIVAMTAAGMDPLDSQYGMATAAANMISFIDSKKTDDGFAFGDTPGTNAMATYQAVYGLEAYVRFVEGGNSLYDLTDVGQQPAEVDKTALQAKVDEAKALVEADYTADSWTAYQKALEAAQSVLADDKADQAVVDSALADLTAAQAALVKAEEPTPDVDKTALQAKVDEAAGLAEADYTVDSWTAYQEALTAAQSVLADDNADQAAVDSALADLTAAQEALVKAEEPEPTTHTVTIDVEKFTIGQGWLIEPIQLEYTEGENVAQVLDRFLKENGYSYSNTGSLTSGFYLSGINNADTGEINVPAYITDMSGGSVTTESTIAFGGSGDGSLNEMDYNSAAGWYYFVNNVALNVGMDGTQVQDGDVIRIQFTLWGYGADLTGTVYGEDTPRVVISNKDDALRAMAQVNSADNKDELLGYANVKAAYDDVAAKVQDATTPQSDLDAAVQSLADALDNPSNPTPDVDKTALQAKVDEAAGLAEADYTADSWTAYQEALAAAQVVLADDNANQAAVDSALEALTTAQAALVKAEEPTPDVDKTDLQTKVDEAASLAEADYTADSWAAYQEALAAAQAVLANDNADQAAVDKALADLTAAQAALVKAEEPGTDQPTNPSTPGDNTGNTGNGGTGNGNANSGNNADGKGNVYTGVESDYAAAAGAALVVLAAAAVAIAAKKRKSQ